MDTTGSDEQIVLFHLIVGKYVRCSFVKYDSNMENCLNIQQNGISVDMKFELINSALNCVMHCSAMRLGLNFCLDEKKKKNSNFYLDF